MRLVAIIPILVLLLGVSAAFPEPGDTVVERDTKTLFERTLAGESDGVRLTCTGTACRKKTAFNAKVFAMAHWIDAAAAAGPLAPWRGRAGSDLASEQPFYEALSSADIEKRIGFVLMRKLKSEQLREGFEAGLRLANGGVLPPDTGDFLAFFDRDLRKGSTMALKSLPGGTVVLMIDGQEKGRVPDNSDLSTALWRVYFGERVSDKHMETVKANLVSGFHEAW